MKEVIIGLLALASLSAFASETIEKPRFDKAKITCSSNLTGVCKTLGFNTYTEGSVRCGNYKFLGGLSNYEPYQNVAFSARDTDLVQIDVNTYRSGRPSLLQEARDALRAYSLNYVYKNYIGSANSKIIKSIQCE